MAIDEGSHIKNNNDFRNYLNAMIAAAPTVAGIFAEWRLVGQKWLISTLNRFPGTFGSVNLAPTGGKVVVLSNAADPAASGASAAAVAAATTKPTTARPEPTATPTASVPRPTPPTHSLVSTC